MCLTCHPLKKYSAIHTKEDLEMAKQHAMSYMAQGNIEKTFELQTDDFDEIQYYCHTCGTKHVLWLHHFYLEHGGEWRTVSAH